MTVKHVFIAGTDTEVGKTYVTCALLRALQRNGTSALAMKPVAAGAARQPDGLLNDDALTLLEHSSTQLPYSTINPFVYEHPTSPNIAAELSGDEITLGPIQAAFETCAAATDVVLVEGIGGWRVPLSDSVQTVDLVRSLSLPVVLVCGLRLGGINHALLSAEAILADGIDLIGWIANIVDPKYEYLEASIETIRNRLPCPLIGISPWLERNNVDIINQTFDASVAQIWPHDLPRPAEHG